MPRTIKNYAIDYNSNKIIELKEGKIKESGNHNDLYNLNGEYSK